MAESINEKLKRVRKPRVHITYDVETEGAVERKEIPFVVGVIADLSGNPTEKLKSYKERKFVNVDRDNFDKVLQSMKPGLKMRVKNTLEGGDKEMGVDLAFNSIDDFEPGAIVQQVKPLAELLEARNKLRDLLGKIDTSEELEETLEQILQNTESVTKLASELGLGKESGSDD
jgi:type VI secretion system protein ImpB